MEVKPKIIPANNKLNSGLILEKHNEKDHVVGGISVGGLQISKPEARIIFSDGHGWHDVVSSGEGEAQKNNIFDTFSCVPYNSLKALCKYLKKEYNEDIDPLEAYTAVMSNTIPGKGNTVRNVLEAIRNIGWLEEKELPSRVLTETTTQAQFFHSFTFAQIALAKKKLDKYDIWWDIIDTSSNVPHSKIISELKKAPVIAIGYAWASYLGQQGVYYDYNYPANHCFLIDEYIENDSVSDLLVNDSYRFDWSADKPDHTDLNDFVKKLAKTYKVAGAWRIYATPKKKEVLLLKLKNMIKDIWMWFETVGSPKGVRAYFVPKDSQGNIKGKQEIDLENPVLAIKALYSALYTAGVIKKTDRGEISTIKDEKFI